MSNNDEKQQFGSLNCEIVCDLLPLYRDNIVSKVTSIAVKEHLESCQRCKTEYDALCIELPTAYDNNDSTNLQTFC